ncbi:hypothetical protein NP493_660g05017 [Ridgeia piscesae]|uniref:Uncharacterized protein n=1 Tax=Ridgeia piscesae TaxID=27915 RepID=A0AAD9KS64_RIDPI|nr:hypothetical protein NP493_660g05017 [Ridgeia piscesae]
MCQPCYSTTVDLIKCRNRCVIPSDLAVRVHGSSTAYSTRSMMADAADHDLFHETHKQRGPNVSSKCRHIMTPPLFAKSTVTPCSHGHPCSTKGRYRCAWRVRVTETSFRISVSSRSR